jgi:hypothetical protein
MAGGCELFKKNEAGKNNGIIFCPTSLEKNKVGFRCLYLWLWCFEEGKLFHLTNNTPTLVWSPQM